MKKLTKIFKTYVWWLIIAITATAFIYVYSIVFASTENLSKAFVNHLPIAIVTSCIFILPPLVALIVISAKKQVFIIYDETKDINYYKSFNRLSIEANCINNYYEKFIQNEQIKQICANYSSKNTIHLRLFEFIILPVTRYSNDLYRLNVGDIYGANTDYLKQLKLYNNDILKKNLGYLKSVKIFLDNWGKPDALNNVLAFAGQAETKKEFKEIYNLFHILENQGLIVLDKNDRKEAFKAICFMIYRSTYMNLIKEAKANLDNLGMNETNSPNEIMEKMYNFDIAPHIISNALFFLESKNNDFFNLVVMNYDKCDKQVKSFINNQLEKRKLESLMNSDSSTTKINISDIDIMSGAEFELFITNLFNQIGYKASNTKLSGDQGIDVIAEKGNTRIAIQTKCYSKPVGNHAIMEAVAGAKYYNANKCMVITNSTFTKSARELAKSNNVVLWDRQTLKEKLEQI